MAQISPIIRLNSIDNVVVAIREIAQGTTLEDLSTSISTQALIPAGHKIASRKIAAGEPILKYGQTVGFASKDILTGDWVHTHNVDCGSLKLEYRYADAVPETDFFSEVRQFQGYRRPNGKAATRNYVAIVSTVNCSATSSKCIADQVGSELLEKYPHVDGVIALTHKGGCAFEYQGSDHEQLNRTLAGYARHPNICGYLVIGLGCETAQADYLVDSQGLVQLESVDTPAKKSRPMINIQQAGGVRKTIEKALSALPEILQEADRARREPISASELIVATECGGSDGYSGITANPAIGVASDLIVRSGGTAILSEVPEIYGGEHLLTSRAVSREVGEKLIERIHWWEDYADKFKLKIDNNPSVGNKKGGLTTIYEKSLGAIAKGGSTALTAVYEYAEPVTAKGFVIMDTPGYDPASVTGMIAGGATVSLFSTGRGSCFGSKPTPTLKICSNTATFDYLSEDMDINAGDVLEGTSLEEKGLEIFEEILAVASGKKTKSEAAGIGDEEFCPWSPGPIF